jgi:hypothetical protein
MTSHGVTAVAELRKARTAILRLASVNRKQSVADSSLCDVAWGLETAALLLANRIERLTDKGKR